MHNKITKVISTLASHPSQGNKMALPNFIVKKSPIIITLFSKWCEEKQNIIWRGQLDIGGGHGIWSRKSSF